MYFKRIELNGFKSFADPVTIEFTDGITCIVGPNGSGKSNISDAIRWVLGEQSPKMLRGGKMEEVIFSGTQNRKPKGMAEVTLVIDNATHILPIDYNEVALTRRMYRSGESEYMINHAPCRLRDIRELIMDTGIGVEGYSIIGQGRIADIVDNKMDSRREIFEEAAGVTKYRTKKAEAEKKLAGAGSNLDRVNDIVGEIESRIGGLEEDSKKASEYLVLRDKYRDVEINIILKNIELAESRTSAVSEELAELTQKSSDAEKQKAELEDAAKEARARNSAIEERLNDVRDGLLKKTEEIHEISGRDELNRERLVSLAREKERLEAELAVTGEKLSRERSNAFESEKTRRGREAEKERLGDALKEQEERAAKSAAELSGAEAELAAAKNRVLELSGKIAASTAEASGIRNLRDTLLSRAERLREASPENGRNAVKQRMDELVAEEASLRADAEKYRKTAEEQTKKLGSLTDELRRISSETEELKINKGQYSARLRLLEELERSYEGYGGGVKFLLKQDVKGIIGTLGELLQVPRGFEVAVETVLGAKLQDIVCEDEDVAKKSIALLKANKAGRLTFLPVDTLRAQRFETDKKIASSAGYLGRASELVSCRGGYENVIDYMLGRVIFVDDLDNAVRMSRINDGGWRFVTKEGEVINAAGAITGGSLKNNTANILTRKAEIDRLAEKLAAAEKSIKAAEKRSEDTGNSIASAEAERASLAAELRRAETELAVIEREKERLAEAERDARAGEERRLAEIAELEKDITDAEKDLQTLERSLKALEQERTEAESSAAEYEEDLEDVRAAAAESAAAETAARLEANAAEVQLIAAREMEQRVLETIKELESDLESREAAIRSNDIARAQIEEFGETAGDILKEKEEEKKALEDEAAKLSEERRSASAEAEDLEQQRQDADRSLYEAQLKKHDAEVRFARFESQSETLKEKLWDEFEMSYAQALDHANPDFVMSRALKESREYKDRIRALGDVNIGAIEEYRTTKERYDFLTAQRDDILKAIEELNTVISDMDATIRKRFKENFDSVAENFESTFNELFKGGHARLTMEDPANPLESVIEIEAQPPGKKLQNMNLLSGGEKTMTAIALMFAVLKTKPTPFVILDEVEAALDDANIDCFARYLHNFDMTQFALVTHQKVTMEYANALYGVTMPEHGITKVLSLRLGDDIDI
ncbi:MAG: chromosome segregation protein SMC [Firmicutes bacterium]|nr:chromosome segregation protein SMC [Bacillota bacterium]